MMNATDRELVVNDPLHAGYAALARGAWKDAYANFAAALHQTEIPEALEGLGLAAWWLDDAAVTFHSRERAYHLYRQCGEYQGAARVASYLAYDYYSFRGEYAIANGWLQRAHRLLTGLDAVPEQGLLAIYEGYFALMLHNDTTTAQRLGTQAAALGRTLGVIDLEMLALALEGLAQVSAGNIAEGMRCLDESTMAAVSGEMTDPDASVTVCCYLIYACERVRDYDRAAQWCDYMKDVSLRWRYPMMFSYCRMHYAGVLIWRGDWAEAEATLLAATNDLIATRPAEAAEGIVRLADLRRRQGRFGEAATLFVQAESHPFRLTGDHLALLGRAALALDQGDAAAALHMVERFLRQIPAENRTERTAALELLVLAHVARGDQAHAQIALAELETLATTIATDALRAAANFMAGIIAAADGKHDTACHHFEDAVNLYKRSGASFETARARIELARALLALGRTEAAGQQARKAYDVLQGLGAAPEADRAASLLGDIEAVPPKQGNLISKLDWLTPREIDVLRLIVAGKSNQEIATVLVLSVRTIERHISNIYQKMGVSGKAARAAATAYALHHGLSS